MGKLVAPYIPMPQIYSGYIIYLYIPNTSGYLRFDIPEGDKSLAMAKALNKARRNNGDQYDWNKVTFESFKYAFTL